MTEDQLLITLVEADQRTPNSAFVRVYTAQGTAFLSHGGLPDSALTLTADVETAFRRLHQRGYTTPVQGPQGFMVSEAGRARSAQIKARP